MPFPVTRTTIMIPAGRFALKGELSLPRRAGAVVILAHGSAKRRFSAGDAAIAARLEDADIATLSLDLLSEDESEAEDGGRKRFDISLLSERLSAAGCLLRALPETARLKMGFFAASTDAAAAILTAAREDWVDAVVCRGGRPDLAGHALAHVQAPTLLIVGADDHPQAILWNREALAELHGIRELALVPHAGHLFEGPGCLAGLSDLAEDWFSSYLCVSA